METLNIVGTWMPGTGEIGLLGVVVIVIVGIVLWIMKRR